MRKLIVTNIVSLDGYHEGPEGVMQLPMDDAFDAHNLERLEAADTLLLGATTFRGFQGFWPSVADDPTFSDSYRGISRRNNEIAKVIISDSEPDDLLDTWRTTTTVVPRADAKRAVEDLKQQDGGDILVFGSRTMWNGLLDEGLVDEIQLMVGPVVLRGGVPAFAAPHQLTLTGTRGFEGSGNVLLTYTA
jgi:dihydrofolate reductase